MAIARSRAVLLHVRAVQVAAQLAGLRVVPECDRDVAVAAAPAEPIVSRPRLVRVDPEPLAGEETCVLVKSFLVVIATVSASAGTRRAARACRACRR